METNNKLADNRDLIVDNRSEYRKRLEDYNTKIDIEKSKIRNLDDIEDIVVSLNKNVNTCVSLLRESMKGKNITNKLNSIEESNAVNLSRTIGNIDVKKEELESRIVSLNDEKEKYEDKFRDKNNEVKKESED